MTELEYEKITAAAEKVRQDWAQQIIDIEFDDFEKLSKIVAKGKALTDLLIELKSQFYPNLSLVEE